MAEPMSDKRLAQLRQIWADDGKRDWPEELFDEIDRLRAELASPPRPSYELMDTLYMTVDRLALELAARPEPIGYVVARQDKNGRLRVWDDVYDTAADARDQAAGMFSASATFPVAALIPVLPQEGPS